MPAHTLGASLKRWGFTGEPRRAFDPPADGDWVLVLGEAGR